MSALSTFSAYGFMFVMLLVGNLLKDRKAKYHLRMTGYWYMVFLNITQAVLEEEIWFKFYFAVFTTFWIYLAYNDFRSTKFFDREFARLDKAGKELQASIDRGFYNRRN